MHFFTLVLKDIAFEVTYFYIESFAFGTIM